MEGGDHGLFEDIILAFVLRDQGKPYNSISTAGNPARIQTKYLTNKFIALPLKQPTQSLLMYLSNFKLLIGLTTKGC
jgi:hypothetical protein